MDACDKIHKRLQMRRNGALRSGLLARRHAQSSMALAATVAVVQPMREEESLSTEH